MEPSAAQAALAATGFDIKAAVLVARLDLSPAEASERLVASGGRLRRALEDEG